MNDLIEETVDNIRDREDSLIFAGGLVALVAFAFGLEYVLQLLGAPRLGLFALLTMFVGFLLVCLLNAKERKEIEEMKALQDQQAIQLYKEQAVELSEAQEALASAEQVHDKLGREVTRLRQENASARQAIASAGHELRTCSEELSRCKDELGKALAGASKESARADELQSQVQKLQGELEQAQAQSQVLTLPQPVRGHVEAYKEAMQAYEKANKVAQNTATTTAGERAQAREERSEAKAKAEQAINAIVDFE